MIRKRSLQIPAVALHNGLLFCYEGTNITGERVVNHPSMQLNDALIEFYVPDDKNDGPVWTAEGVELIPSCRYTPQGN